MKDPGNSFKRAKTVKVLSINNKIGLCAGDGHPNKDAPDDMADGSRYFRTNGSEYVKRYGYWRKTFELTGSFWKIVRRFVNRLVRRG